LFALLALSTAGCGDHLADKQDFSVVHRERSLYRDVLVVDQGEGYRCVAFARQPGAQSCILRSNPDILALPYSRGVFAALTANPKARRVLVIGLGGGVIPRALRRIDPDMRIDVVELDPAVADVARRYFGYREDPRLRTHIGDGRVFVRRQLRAGVRYDIVVIDAFERVYVPEHFLTREFLSQVKAVLAPGGMVASNTFTRGPLVRYEAATYQAVFGEVRMNDMLLGSRILLAGRDGIPPVETLTANAEAMRRPLSRIGVQPWDLISKPQPRAVGVRPLTDQYSPANLMLERHDGSE
jgi:spermidine synthase